MTRRMLIAKAGVWSALATIGDFSFLKLAPPYRVVILNQSRGVPAAPFGNAEDFWRKHQDTFAESLNAEFLRSGRLLHVESTLGDDGKSAILVKHYRSKNDHLEYVRLLTEHHNKFLLSGKTISRTVT